MADGIDATVSVMKQMLTGSQGANAYLGRIVSATPSSTRKKARVAVTVRGMDGSYLLPLVSDQLDDSIRSLGNAAKEFQVLIISVAGQWVGLALVKPGGKQ